MTERRNNIASIQFLRAIAAMMVVAMHNQYFFADFAKLTGAALPAMSSWYQFKTFGGIGVPIFFVISGFIMSFLHERNPEQRFLGFMNHRLTRIVPLYWIICGFMVWNSHSVSRDFVIRSMLFVPVKEFFPLVGVGWTLNYEMFFYVLFGLIVVQFRRSIWWLALIFVLLQASAPYTNSYVVKFYGDPIVWNFFAGLLIHRIYRSRFVRNFSPLALTAGICGFLLAATVFSPARIVGFSALIKWGIPSVFLVLGCVSLESMGMMRKLWGIFPMQGIGASSYSLYLVHGLLFINFNWYFLEFTQIVRYLGPDAAIVALIMCACLAGYLCHRLIELPAQNLFRFRKKTGVPLVV